MLNKYSLKWPGNIVTQRHQRTWFILFKQADKFLHKQHKWLLYNSDAKHGRAGISFKKGCSGALYKCLNYSQRLRDLVYYFNELLINRAVCVSERYICYHSENLKASSYCHGNKYFFVPMKNFNQGLLHSVPCFIRFFHTETDRKQLSEDGDTMKNQTITDIPSTEEISPEEMSYAGTTANKTKLSGKDITKLAKILHCSVFKMQDLADRYEFFTHLSPDLILSKVNVMVFYGLPYSFVSDYPRILYQTSAKELHRRLELCKKHSFLTENSMLSHTTLASYLECRNDFFNHLFDRLCEERDSLEGCKDQLDYLQFRLKCSKEQAQKLLSSYPLGKNVSNIKLKRLLDFFLTEAKLSPQFVMAHRGLLTFSTVRLRKRWEVIQSEGINSETLIVSIWKMPQKEFERKYLQN